MIFQEECKTCKWLEKQIEQLKNKPRQAMEAIALTKAKANHLQAYHHGQRDV